MYVPCLIPLRTDDPVKYPWAQMKWYTGPSSFKMYLTSGQWIEWNGCSCLGHWPSTEYLREVSPARVLTLEKTKQRFILGYFHCSCWWLVHCSVYAEVLRWGCSCFHSNHRTRMGPLYLWSAGCSMNMMSASTGPIKYLPGQTLAPSALAVDTGGPFAPVDIQVVVPNATTRSWR